MKTSIFALALIVGAGTAAFAEDSSTAFSQNVYGQITQTQTFEGRNGLTSRNVSLPEEQIYYRTQPSTSNAGYDRASSSYGGSSF